MNVYVNDTNILIDLIKLDLMKFFIKLNWKLYTTDFVLSEIEIKQQREIKRLKNRITIVETATDTDYFGINELFNNSQNNVSFVDASVLYYSKKYKGILLTGDKKLRKYCKEQGVEVRGIIYIFDMLVEKQLLKQSIASKKLKQLLEINPRIPYSEIEKRISKWSSS